MKKTKKLASWILALTMVAGIVPAMAEENTNGEAPVVTKESTTSLLFAEDFEGYEVGVVAENPVDATTVKNYENEAFNLTLHPGDKLEIAEENGNKYMKLTVGNTTTSETKILYNFPESYVGGEKRVSYDFYPEVHSRRFNFLGVVNDSIKSTRAQMMCTYGNAIYLSNGVGGSVPGIFGFLDVNKYSGEFGTITQTLTLDGATKTSSVRARSVGQKEEKTGNCLASTAVSFMEWSAIKHSIAAYNGSVKAEDGSDVAGVYRIDNITVEDVKKLGGDVTKITEDFEGYPEGKLYEKVANATFTVQNGDSIEIAKDPVTGSKGIKITKSDKSTEITKVVFDYGEVADDVVKISYDVRFQNHSKLLQGFPMLSTGATWINYRNNIYWSGTMNANTTFANWLNVAGDTNVQHIEFIHDPKAASNNTTVALIKSNGAVYTGSYNVGAGQAFKTVTFNTDYATASEGASAHMGQSTGDGVYWIDNITVEIMQLRLENSSIKDGETAVSVKKDLILNFNEAVSETIKELIVVKKGAESLVYGEDYTVTLSDDSKTVTIDAVGGKWEYETNYEVVIPETDGLTNMKPYSGTKINFVTGKFSSVLVDDNFSYLTVGDRWEVPADETEGKTVAIGENISVKMQPGDSVEYAYDEVRGQYGLKLIKGITAGEMDFLYNFPEKYENGKYRVTVDERIAHHSKAHPYWPALLDGSGAVIETGFYGSGYWIGRTGNFGVDRFGVDWSAVNASRFIEGYGENNSVVGEIITGIGCRIGTHNPETDIYQWSKEPAITKTSLGGIRMKMNWTGSSSANWSTMYVPGSAKETEENPNNDGIAWIYSVKVEEIRLDVIETSFEKSQLEFSPSEPLTITFNESLDLSTVNADTFKLYKGDELIDSYEYNVSLSENGKTVTLSPVAGLEYGTEYTIKITKNVKPTEKVIDGLWDEKIYTIKVEEYENKSNPDIVWSSIPNGSQNVDYNIDSIILSTDDVLLDAATVTKDNIKVYENGVEIDTYQVSVEEIFAVKVTFDGLKKDATYKIIVTGLKSGGENSLEMTTDYELNFTTRDDIYTENVESKISADGEKSVITAELFNKSTTDVNYQVIGVLKDSEGKILSVNYGSNGIISANGYADITVEAVANESAECFELYIWDGMGTMKPLVKKAELNSVNARTYGYDNFVDSSKAVRIAFIGGSITQQSLYTTPLRKSLTTYLKTNNADRDVKFVNHAADGGVGGTGSDLGIYRLEKDVISKSPDVVFIEFAVNDANNANKVKTMEGMIRKLMNLDHQPVVILLNVTTIGYASFSSIADWEPLMQAYGIGSVNVAEYIKSNIASEENPDGIYVWKAEDLNDYPEATVLTNDGVHPNAEGGKIYADFMYKMLTENADNLFKKMTYVAEPISGFEYNNPRLISWKAATYDDNWNVKNDLSWAFLDGVANAKSSGATLTFKFTGTTIGLYAPRSKSGSTATYSIDDGAYTGTVRVYTDVTVSKMEMATMISTDLPEGEHTITINVNDIEDNYFQFGYFIVD